MIFNIIYSIKMNKSIGPIDPIKLKIDNMTDLNIDLVAKTFKNN